MKYIIVAIIIASTFFAVTQAKGTESPEPGDINCDGIVSATDALQILRYVADLPADTCSHLGPTTLPKPLTATLPPPPQPGEPGYVVPLGTGGNRLETPYPTPVAILACPTLPWPNCPREDYPTPPMAPAPTD